LIAIVLVWVNSNYLIGKSQIAIFKKQTNFNIRKS